MNDQTKKIKKIGFLFYLEGTFGVPLDTLVEKSGTDSNLGAGPSRIRIPMFIDDSIATMRQMGMSFIYIFT